MNTLPINPVYQEHSTGDNFCDSIAYGYEKLGDPGVIHFYKRYNKHISGEMLTLYHHIHNVCSQLTIPTLQLTKPIAHNGNQYTDISFSIIDLDPNKIYKASDVSTKESYWVTEPDYIDTDMMFLFSIDRFVKQDIQKYLHAFLMKNKIYLNRDIDIHNIKFNIVANKLHCTIVDLGSSIVEFCSDNLERANIYIPLRKQKNICNQEQLQKTLL